jgi:hypothetical protein
VSIEVPANAVGEEMLAGRLSLVTGDQVLAQSLVLANCLRQEPHWSRLDVSATKTADFCPAGDRSGTPAAGRHPLRPGRAPGTPHT